MDEIFALLNAYARIKQIAEEYQRPIKRETTSYYAKQERLKAEYIAILDKFKMADMPCTLVLYISDNGSYPRHMRDNYL